MKQYFSLIRKERLCQLLLTQPLFAENELATHHLSFYASPCGRYAPLDSTEACGFLVPEFQRSLRSLVSTQPSAASSFV